MITPGDTQTSSFVSVLGEIVKSVSQIHSNLEKNTLLPLVDENHLSTLS